MADDDSTKPDLTSLGARALFALIGLACIVAGISGGEITFVFGIQFSRELTGGARWGIIAIGSGTLVIAAVYGKVNLTTANPTVKRRLIIGATTILFLGLLLTGVIVLRGQLLVSDPPPLASVPTQCALRTGSPGGHHTSRWILQGLKNNANYDTLDEWRVIVEPCVVRDGETATIYRRVQVWEGDDQSGPISPTVVFLKPGTKITVRGSVFGTAVYRYDPRTRHDDIFLHYEVWSSFIQ